jgi:hypothetical protein
MTTLAEKFRMAAVFDNAAIFNYQDPVSFFDSG